MAKPAAPQQQTSLPAAAADPGQSDTTPNASANSNATTPAQFPVVPASWIGISPTQMVSAPDHVDWHLIQDHELTALSNAESGAVQSLGFAGLGGAISLIASFVAALGKIGGAHPTALNESDWCGLLLFPVMTVTAAICLILSLINGDRNKKLVADIRRRKKTGALD